MTQDNKYYPGGCSIGYNNYQYPAGSGTEPLNVPEKLFTKTELDAVVDAVTNSLTRTIGSLRSEISYLEDQNRDMNLNYREAREEIQHLNGRVDTLEEIKDSYDKTLKDANEGWSEAGEYIYAYRKLVHAREYVRKQKAMTSSFGYYYGVDKAESILTNALIDMEG